MKEYVKITIGEPQEILRNSLAAYLNSINGYSVIDHQSSGKELIKMVKANLPDLILLDLGLKELDGIETLLILKNRFPDIKIVMFCNEENDQIVLRLFNSGANAVISKTASLNLLNYTLKEVCISGSYISEAQAALLKERKKVKKNESLINFSEREKQVINEICNGLTNEQISKRLFITLSTVDFHKQKIYRKTNSRNVLDLYKYAIKSNLISVN